MTQESQALDPYDIVLNDLRAQRDEIDAAIRSLERLRGVGPTRQTPTPEKAQTEQPTPVPSEGPGAFLGMTVVEATKKLLSARRQAMSNSDIVPALERGGVVLNSIDKLNTVGSILTRRFNNVGDIVRVSRGTWGLQEWYGSRNFKKKAKEEPVDATEADASLGDSLRELARAAANARPSIMNGDDVEDDPWAPVDQPAPRGVFK